MYCVLYNLYVVLYTSRSYSFSLLDSLRALSLSPFLSAYYLLHHIWGLFRNMHLHSSKEIIWNNIYITRPYLPCIQSVIISQPVCLNRSEYRHAVTEGFMEGYSSEWNQIVLETLNFPSFTIPIIHYIYFPSQIFTLFHELHYF